MIRGEFVPLILQTNLNHARRAQDLFLHTMAERGCWLGAVAEPYAVPPDHPSWFPGGCLGGAAPLVAIVRGGDDRTPSCRMVAGDRHYAAVEWGTLCVVEVYLPPR